MAVAATTLVGCSQASPGTSSTTGPTGSGPAASTAGAQSTTIDVWARQGDAAMPDLVKAFNDSQSAVVANLTVVPDAELLTKFSTAVRSGNAPDVVDFDLIDGPLLATQGTLLDITDKIGGLSDASDLIPAFVDAGTIDGKKYAVPVVGVGSQMEWNKGLFTQAGLDPDKAPQSLAEVKADAEKIRALGADVYGFSTLGSVAGAYTGFPSIWASGGDVLTAAGKDQEATFDDPAVEGVVSWYHDVWSEGLMPPTDAPNQDPNGLSAQEAQSGKIGIIFSGTWIVRSAAAGQELGYADGIPGLDGGLSSFIGGQSAGIVATSDAPDQSWAFLQWVLSDEQSATIIAKSGGIPGNLAAAAKQFTDDPIALSGIEALKTGKAPVSVAYSAVINDANGPWTTASQAVVFNGADAKTELSKANDEARSIIEDAYSTLGG